MDNNRINTVDDIIEHEFQSTYFRDTGRLDANHVDRNTNDIIDALQVLSLSVKSLEQSTQESHDRIEARLKKLKEELKELE